MKSAIIIHGMPSEESYIELGGKVALKHWRPWLRDELTARGIQTEVPEMPEPYQPDYEKWSEVFERFPISEDTFLVGHSAGGGFLVRWLSEHTDVRVGRVALVAPWIDPHHKFAPKMFTGYDIDEDLIQRTAGVAMFCSSDDEQDEVDSFKVLKEKLKGLDVREYSDSGHFTFEDMNTKEFPELLQYLLS